MIGVILIWLFYVVNEKNNNRSFDCWFGGYYVDLNLIF